MSKKKKIQANNRVTVPYMNRVHINVDWPAKNYEYIDNIFTIYILSRIASFIALNYIIRNVFIINVINKIHAQRIEQL